MDQKVHMLSPIPSHVDLVLPFRYCPQSHGFQSEQRDRITGVPPPMDPPPAAVPTLAAATNQVQVNHPDSLESSPRARIGETLADEPLPPVPGAKLRLMCSYGGHIMPRPHDKTLCYVGGDTRIVVVDRHSSRKDLCGRLSRSLLHGRPFTLKYQLPNEDLDNLITVSTDEDHENMIEEYDRITAASSLKPSRLRLFLFFNTPETAVTMGSLLDDAKSETWFVDALNNSGILDRVVSDSVAVGGLVNLDRVPASDSSNSLEAQAAESLGENNKQVKGVPDVHSLPESPMVLENSSSYGSSLSSPSMANLPPIRVRVEDNGSRLQQEQRPGIEEQFSQMTFATSGMKQEDGYGNSVVPPPPMPSIPSIVAVPSSESMVVGENTNRIISDDERSDKGAPAGWRKPPLPVQIVQPRTSGGFAGTISFPSPDSVASDSSIASANSFSKPVCYQDQVQAAHGDNKAPPSLTHIKSEISEPQAQDSGYTLPSQLDQNQQHQQQQPQYVHASTHYIPHPAVPGAVPMSSYYPVYAPSSQQQVHHPIGQQYPVYVMPVGATQAYNMTLQPNIVAADPSVIASGRAVVPQSAAAAPAAYKDGTPPIYPTKAANPVASSAAFVQIPSGQFQQQYVGVPQIHPPPQSITVAPPATSNYNFEYVASAQDQPYYPQQQTPTPLPPQYQSMTPAAALSDASKQHPAETIQQQNRTSQPV
ncbi:hypothetical protein L6164_008049 [Bauhinia variegata]|uniref:Uncharacterized protein n=1 Tax=Bauhinia variegata TaxID=167791 RepID=A0ACB9PEC8_BAUVA|nr:hypothetical protein L6164_008049 [Bauhinia variegata]